MAHPEVKARGLDAARGQNRRVQSTEKKVSRGEVLRLLKEDWDAAARPCGRRPQEVDGKILCILF